VISSSTASVTRILSIATGDANRTLTLSGDATLSGTNTGDQTIILTGDVTGSGTASFAATLANTAVTAGSYGSATQTVQVTFDGKGRATSATAVTVTPAWSSVTGKPTTLGGYGITDALSGSSSSLQNGTFNGVYLQGAASSYYLDIEAVSTLTANRVLSIATGDANRTLTLTLNADATLSGTNTGDQTITLTGDVTGSGTGSFAATLAASGVTAGSYGSATQSLQVTFDAKAGLHRPQPLPLRRPGTASPASRPRCRATASPIRCRPARPRSRTGISETFISAMTPIRRPT
jgi:hypothetical protein